MDLCFKYDLKIFILYLNIKILNLRDLFKWGGKIR
jgi:hypothetical protein